MSLLDAAKTEAGVAGTEEKTSKKSNYEYQKKQKEKALASANLIAKVIERAKVTLSAEEQEALDFLCRKPKAGAAGGNFGAPVINKIFGAELKAGAKATAIEVLEKTGKGFAEMRQLMKKWAKNNIIVVYDEKVKAYVINKLA